MFLAGIPAEARQHSAAGQRLYDPELHRSHRHLYGGHDPGVCALQTGAQLDWLLGYPDRAVAGIAEAMALGEQFAHPFSMEIAVTYAAMIHLNRGEPELALARIKAAEALAAEQRISFIMEPLFLHGAALLEQGAAGEAIAAIRQGLASGRPVATVWRSYGLSFCGEALARQGDDGEAHTVIDQAFDAIRTTGEGMWHAEVHRIHGLVLLAENKRIESEAAFRRALDLARVQQARSLELRPRLAWRDPGATRVGWPRHRSCWLRSAAGSPRGSTPATSSGRRCYSTNLGELVRRRKLDSNFAVHRRSANSPKGRNLSVRHALGEATRLSPYRLASAMAPWGTKSSVSGVAPLVCCRDQPSNASS